ncbi:uncharacterized protein LOC120337745 isoform X1 [Styela clava]
MVIMSMILIVELLLLLSSIALITNASQLQKSCISEGMEIDAGKLSKTTWYSGLMKQRLRSLVPDSLISRLQKLDSKLFQRKMGPEFIHLEHGEEMNGLANEAVSNMDNLLDNAAIVFLSDYENYFAALLCPLDKDHQVIRGFFPSPNPTL